MSGSGFNVSTGRTKLGVHGRGQRLDNGLMNSVKGMFTHCIDGHQSPSTGRAGGTHWRQSDRRKSNQSDTPLFLLDQIIDLVQAVIFDPAASSAVIHLPYTDFYVFNLAKGNNVQFSGKAVQIYSAIAPMRQQIYFDMPVLDLEPFGLLTCVFHVAFFHPPASSAFIIIYMCPEHEDESPKKSVFSAKTPTGHVELTLADFPPRGASKPRKKGTNSKLKDHTEQESGPFATDAHPQHEDPGK
ncbi:hypothetical protein K438DRAFT_1782957 [Mycena galopus ATCC 62051]|nr:hypothetical protein K438DRAFT_1782957 [Mycena galopus ATCC 62051]